MALNFRNFLGGPLAASVLFVGGRAGASDSIFMLIPGIPGASVASGHVNWIEADSLQFSAEKSPGRNVSFADLAITKSVDNASPLLAQGCATGTYIPNATVQVVATNQLVYQISLDNVTITSDTQSASASGATTEGVSLRFGKITWTYQATTTSWDALYGTIPINIAASGVQTVGSGVMSLTWQTSAGATYNILGSSQVNGPYTLIQSFTGTNLGPTSITVPATTNMFFFQVQELP